LQITIEAVAIQGDKILGVALAKTGDKSLFTKELKVQMLVKRADIAVHGLRDLTTQLPDGLMPDGRSTETRDPGKCTDSTSAICSF